MRVDHQAARLRVAGPSLGLLQQLVRYRGKDLVGRTVGGLPGDDAIVEAIDRSEAEGQRCIDRILPGFSHLDLEKDELQIASVELGHLLALFAGRRGQPAQILCGFDPMAAYLSKATQPFGDEPAAKPHSSAIRNVSQAVHMAFP
ncbi:hypothetical protein [Roseicella sp. DB1501]|uniref:hypothetical protein n=1 Tax=Roseicella sp. DB1501 TaxID=2730925 RepID=UPI00149282A8|nr:hypothetical protein [Roseicella sp. DB1501]NOG70254.1 hypothetical protein [Roseicella sp. DB1501]